MKRLIPVVFTAAALLFLSGCGEDGSLTDDLVEAFVEQGAPEEESRCVAEQLDGVSVEDVEAFGDAESPEDIDAELLVKIGAAVQTCGLAG